VKQIPWLRRPWRIIVLPRKQTIFMSWHTAYVVFKLSAEKWSKPQLLWVNQDSSGRFQVKPSPGSSYRVYYPGEIRIIENIGA